MVDRFSIASNTTPVSIYSHAQMLMDHHVSHQHNKIFHSGVLDGPETWIQRLILHEYILIDQPFDAVSKNDIKLDFEDLILNTLL
jgi:hypothetical protein